MAELERELLALGRELDWPPTPEAVPKPATLQRPSHRGRRGLVLAFALFVLAAGTAFAIPQSREVILDWLGLQGATVERVAELPEVPRTGDLALGERVPLAEARRRAGFEVTVPETLGEPDDVYIAADLAGGRVSLVYRTGERIGLLVTEFRGSQAPELIGKLVAAGTSVERVSVNGNAGLWIDGPPHVFFYRDPDGELRDETLRLAANTLLFGRGDGVLVRIESRLSRSEALAVGESMR